MPDTFTSSQIARIADVSLRRLQWWDEAGVVQPANRTDLDRAKGHTRLYNHEQATEILVVAELRRRNVGLYVARRILAQLRRTFPLARCDARRAGYEGSDFYILTDFGPAAARWANAPDVRRRMFRIEHDARRIVEVLTASQYPVLVIGLSDKLNPMEATR